MTEALRIIRRTTTALFITCIFCLTVFQVRAEEPTGQPAPDQTTLPSADDLPGAAKLAAALSSPDTRGAVLRDSVALLALKARIENTLVTDVDAVITQFNDDLAWLSRLEQRFGGVPVDALSLDPAAWLIHIELAQHDLGREMLISPNEDAMLTLIEQAFDRSGVRLAAAMLPVLSYHAEIAAVPAWVDLRQQAMTDANLVVVLQQAADAIMPLPGFPGEDAGEDVALDVETLLQESMASLQVVASSAVTTSVPDPVRLQELRYTLLTAIHQMDFQQRVQAANILRLCTLIDGLHERRYLAFAEGLLAIVAGLIPHPVTVDPNETDPNETDPPQPEIAEASPPEPEPDTQQAPASGYHDPHMAAWLTEFLPPLSDAYARPFADVDPRLNSVLAAAYDAVQSLGDLSAGEVPAAELDKQLADAVSQLVMLTPDLGFYYDLPVRQTIADEINVCISIAAVRASDDSLSLTREQFDGCQESLVEFAENTARSTELSGDPNGPFGQQQVRRELFLMAWQRINYGIGYLHDRYSTGCEPPPEPLPNPLEWATLANLMTWFASQSPVYFNTPENEQRLQRMRAIGTELIRSLSEQVDCVAGAGDSLDDPIARSISDYRSALDTLVSGMRVAEQSYRDLQLASGADISLAGDASQPTSYRPADIEIGPCEPDLVCEMTGLLSTTRALIGLFPDEYLVADQSGLGEVEICYANMEWTSRRSELVREDDENVANYYGHLSFDLKGRYLENDHSEDVFGFRFTSPDEHQYLFGAATDEVLADSCPTEWVGSRIVTPLNNDAKWLVPNRLTYLSAARATPSRLLSANWDRGAEWRDWFVTGFGVTPLQIEVEQGITERVSQRLRDLYNAQQKAVYDVALRTRGGRQENGLPSLNEDVFTLTTAKSLLRMNAMLFYPQVMLESDAFRSSLEGNSGLLDRRMLDRFHEADLPVADAMSLSQNRLGQLDSTWLSRPEAVRRNGSIPNSVANAQARLNHVYRQYFAARLPAAETAIKAPSGANDGSKGLMQ